MKLFKVFYVRGAASNRLPNFDVEYNGERIEDTEVDKLLSKSNVSKSMRPDGIHPKKLKECQTQLDEPITVIAKQSIATYLVPVLWKIAKICPIFKKGSKLNPLNYRPVSLSSTVHKICETMLKDKIVKHIRRE